MANYKFSGIEMMGVGTKRTVTQLVLKTLLWQVTLTVVRGHMHVHIKGNLLGGPYKQQRLSNVHAALTLFEAKMVAFYFLRAAQRAAALNSAQPRIDNVNYAEVFGGPFE